MQSHSASQLGHPASHFCWSPAANQLSPGIPSVGCHTIGHATLSLLARYRPLARHSCLTLCDPINGSPPGSRPWDSPGKNTGVGCHFLLRCMKVKSESEVAQSCPTLSDPMDCSLPGSSIHMIFQARVLEWGAIAFSNHQVNAN